MLCEKEILKSFRRRNEHVPDPQGPTIEEALLEGIIIPHQLSKWYGYACSYQLAMHYRGPNCYLAADPGRQLRAFVSAIEGSYLERRSLISIIPSEYQ